MLEKCDTDVVGRRGEWMRFDHTIVIYTALEYYVVDILSHV